MRLIGRDCQFTKAIAKRSAFECYWQKQEVRSMKYEIRSMKSLLFQNPEFVQISVKKAGFLPLISYLLLLVLKNLKSAIYKQTFMARVKLCDLQIAKTPALLQSGCFRVADNRCIIFRDRS